uniref:hypothetical protein n=1 Tax=Anaerotruncus colihominis TaxID=169435 RepID=UPI003AB6E2B9
ETGPVANEYKEVLWERFKAASSRIRYDHKHRRMTGIGADDKNGIWICLKCLESFKAMKCGCWHGFKMPSLLPVRPVGFSSEFPAVDVQKKGPGKSRAFS